MGGEISKDMDLNQGRKISDMAAKGLASRKLSIHRWRKAASLGIKVLRLGHR